MGKVRILIEGPKITEVGYRLFLLEKALENGLTKFYARNIDNKHVEILLDDEDDAVDNFYQSIKVEKPEEAEVLDVKQESYSGNIPIPPIETYFQYLTFEQLTKGREDIGKLDKHLPAIAKIASSLSGISTQLGDVITRYGVFGESVESLDNKMSTLDLKMSGVDDKLGKVDEKLGNIDSKLGSIDEKMGTLPERIAEALKGQK